jgi:hypothetical protein
MCCYKADLKVAWTVNLLHSTVRFSFFFRCPRRWRSHVIEKAVQPASNLPATCQQRRFGLSDLYICSSID